MKNSTNPLPQDIKEFIESAEHGVVYFSLGGNLRPSKMSAEKKKHIISTLTKLKQKVIWKWDEELVVDEKRIMVSKWLPQDDILAHPNVKLFVTHGGLLSATESIMRGKIKPVSKFCLYRFIWVAEGHTSLRHSKLPL